MPARAAADGVPADVVAGLARLSIAVESVATPRVADVVEAHGAIRVAAPVPAAYCGGRPSAYLVRIVAHPSAFEPPTPGAVGWSDIGPLHVGDVAWLVVIRNALIPSLNPHHPGVWIETLVFFVPRNSATFAAGMTIPPPARTRDQTVGSGTNSRTS